MTMLVDLLAISLLVTFAFAVVAAVLAIPLAPRLLAVAQSWSPHDRARLSFWLAVGPFVVGSIATLVCFLPSLASVAGLVTDHCLYHRDDHLHLCVVHLARLPHALGVVVLVATMLFVGWRLLREIRLWLRLAPLLHSLPAGEPITESDSVVPFAFTIGRLWPRIVVSRGLRAALDARQLAVVLAHEHDHAARRDLWWRFLADVFSFIHWPPLRDELLAALHLATEQACDETAAEVVGDRVLVAETIVAVERLIGRSPEWAAAFGASDLEARVTALLEPPPARRAALLPRHALTFATLCVLALAHPLHHLTETLLDIVAH